MSHRIDDVTLTGYKDKQLSLPPPSLPPSLPLSLSLSLFLFLSLSLSLSLSLYFLPLSLTSLRCLLLCKAATSTYILNHYNFDPIANSILTKTPTLCSIGTSRPYVVYYTHAPLYTQYYNVHVCCVITQRLLIIKPHRGE